MTFDRIAVLGGGAWGTALANVTARAGRKVTLWEYDAGNAEELAQKRESRFLRGVRIEDSIAVTRSASHASCRSVAGSSWYSRAGGGGKWVICQVAPLSVV